MSVLFDTLLDNLRELHAEIARIVAVLPSDALDWIPGAEMNSIDSLVVHSIGAERYWLGLALEEPPEPDRDAEFHSKGLDASQLQAHLASADEFTRQALLRLSLADLNATRISPRNGKTVTVAWCLAHTLEHTALHTGHIQVTRDFWNLRKI
jgi:uncharacterized damage-inducible protein DinB